MIVHKDITIKNPNEPIGEGGMAKVYLAYHHQFKCDVAVKVLNKEFVYNEDVHSRFIEEARKLFQLNHPQIIRVTQIIDEDDMVAFVMDYINGKTLEQFFDSKEKISTTEIVELYNQMLDALIYIHQKSIIHRDLKPSNFMITTERGIKLLDFGISKSNEGNNNDLTGTSVNAQMGTPMYMSPEQIDDSSTVTNQSDIYSIGVVLWCMVTGKKPYDGSLTIVQIFNKVVNESLEPTNSIFQPIIDKCTEKKLMQRYKDCREIKNDIRKILEKDENKTIVYNYKMGGKTQETIFVNNKGKSTGFNLNLLLNNTKVLIGLGVFIVAIIIALSKSSDSPPPEGPKEPTMETEAPTITTEIPVIHKKENKNPKQVGKGSQNPVKKTQPNNTTPEQKIEKPKKDNPSTQKTKPEKPKKESKLKKTLKVIKEKTIKTIKKLHKKNAN